MKNEMKLSIKQVLPESDEEVARLARLASTIWHEYFPCILSDEQIDYMVATFQSESALRAQFAEGYEYYFICQGEQAVGYFGIQLRPEEDELFLSKLYLLKSTRGTGVGTFALSHIQELARRSSLAKIRLTCNKYNADTLGFYQKRGFRPVDAIITDIGNGFFMDDYVMVLDIQSV